MLSILKLAHSLATSISTGSPLVFEDQHLDLQVISTATILALALR